LNSVPEITRKKEIFPGPENSGNSEDREKSTEMIWMKSFSGKDSIRLHNGLVSQNNSSDIN